MLCNYLTFQCKQSCDERVGVKRRDIACVWKGTNETAGESSCQQRSHPEEVTTCYRETESFALECSNKEKTKHIVTTNYSKPQNHRSMGNLGDLPNKGIL